MWGLQQVREPETKSPSQTRFTNFSTSKMRLILQRKITLKQTKYENNKATLQKAGM